MLNTYLFSKDKEYLELRLAGAICICKIFERLTHFNYAEELLKLVIHIFFNFKNITHIFNKSKEAIIKLSKSNIDSDIKLKQDLVIELYKKVKRNNKNARVPNDLFEVLTMIKFTDIN